MGRRPMLQNQGAARVGDPCYGRGTGRRPVLLLIIRARHVLSILIPDPLKISSALKMDSKQGLLA